jgi:hypothetical protein
MRFIERTHKNERVINALSQNPVAFFCLISKEDLKNDAPFDRARFSKILVKNNILKRRIDPKLATSIKGTCFLVLPKDRNTSITPSLMKWVNNVGVNLLFVKCGLRYYSSLISSVMNKRGIDNITTVIKTLTNMLGQVNVIVDKINGVVCRALKEKTVSKTI